MNKPSDSKENQLDIMRHSTSHLMAAAILELYPKTKFAIGPSIEDGFYYDFDFLEPLLERDLMKIEQKMRELKNKKLDIKNKNYGIANAMTIFKDQPYKVELIKELEKAGEKKVSIYELGEFVDLCRGPHLKNTKEIGEFKLLSLAGAYWKGSEKNKMLTRIYGTVFPTKKHLDEYLNMLEEAKKRDHRKLGKELDLFSFHDEAPGFPFWHPNGMALRSALMGLHDKLHKDYNYQ